MKRLVYSLGAVAVVLSIFGSIAASWIQWTGPVDLLFGVVFALVGVATAVTGSVVAAKVPGNSVGWIILGLGLGLGVLLSATGYAEIGVNTSYGPLPGQSLAGWLGEFLGILVIFGLTGVLLLVFPTGHALSPRWRPFTWCFVAITTVASLSSALIPGPLGLGIENPFGLPGAAGEASSALADLTDLLALPAMALCALSLVLRMRRSRGVERQQLKWFTYGAAAAGLGLGLSVAPGGLVSDVAFLVALLGLGFMPVAAGLAVLRYRLYDIDVVIKRTLVYGSLTAALVAIYLGIVLVFQLLLRPVAGDSDLAVAGSTLAVAALFGPLRAAIQSVVDRRFYRARYDAARTLEGFAARLRHELDLDQLAADLRGVVGETMRPVHVSLWLRGQR